LAKSKYGIAITDYGFIDMNNCKNILSIGKDEADLYRIKIDGLGYTERIN